MSPERERRASELIAKYPKPQSALVPFLQFCQEQDGYITGEAIRDAAELTGITPAEAESISGTTAS